MNEITSRDNSRLKHARAVRDGRVSGEIFIEGLRLAEEAVGAKLKITDCFFTPEFAASERGSALLEKCADVRTANVSAKFLESIADTKSPQGIVILAKQPETSATFLSASPRLRVSASLILILHRLNNPANVGAILRAAEAAGVTGAILTAATADPFSPKSLRGAMGSAFRLPLWTGATFGEAVEFCRENKIKTICAELQAERAHTEIDWTQNAALVIGSEAHGLSAAEIKLCDERLKIPMQPPVESLNAAVAGGVILFEAARQRRRLQSEISGR